MVTSATKDAASVQAPPLLDGVAVGASLAAAVGLGATAVGEGDVPAGTGVELRGGWVAAAVGVAGAGAPWHAESATSIARAIHANVLFIASPRETVSRLFCRLPGKSSPRRAGGCFLTALCLEHHHLAFALPYRIGSELLIEAFARQDGQFGDEAPQPVLHDAIVFHAHGQRRVALLLVGDERGPAAGGDEDGRQRRVRVCDDHAAEQGRCESIKHSQRLSRLLPG